MATFVLVHGATVGGWCWRWVAKELRTAGHEVQIPTMTGLGERVGLPWQVMSSVEPCRVK